MDRANVMAVDTLDDGRVVVSNAEPVASAEGRALSLVVEAEFAGEEGGGRSAPVLGDPVSLATDRSGRTFVADAQAKRIHVFGPDGEFLRSIGRAGSGPGEFQLWLAGVVWQEPDRLWVADASRIMAFDSTGAFVEGSYRSRGGTFSSSWQSWSDTSGFVYGNATALSFGDGSNGPMSLERLVRFRGDGAAATDTFSFVSNQPDHKLVDRGGGIVELRTLPMATESIWTVSPFGTVWLAHTSRYRLDEVSFGGDTLRTVALRREPEPLAGAERDSVAEASESFSASELPENKPVMKAVHAARDGWLWVRRDSRPTVDWDVFDACGRFLGAAIAEVPLGVVAFPGGSTVIGIATDELDVPRIVRMGLRTAEGRAATSPGCET